MLTCIVFGIVASHAAYFIARKHDERGRNLRAYITALAVTIALSLILATVGKSVYDLPLFEANLILVKGVLFGVLLPFHGLWMAKRAHNRTSRQREVIGEPWQGQTA